MKYDDMIPSFILIVLQLKNICKPCKTILENNVLKPMGLLKISEAFSNSMNLNKYYYFTYEIRIEHLKARIKEILIIKLKNTSKIQNSIGST